MSIAIQNIIRSKRRSLAFQITEEGFLVVRAPHLTSRLEILRLVDKEKRWIEKKIHHVTERARTAPPPLTAQEEMRLKNLALDAFIERACLYAKKMGVTFEKVRLSSAGTRWGSCGPQGNLNFNWRLIQAPAEVLDYVVVHELAHLIERNHSHRFWAKVGEFCPGYKIARHWLRINRL